MTTIAGTRPPHFSGHTSGTFPVRLSRRRALASAMGAGLSAVLSAPSLAQDAIAEISMLIGSAEVLRAGQTIAASQGMPIMPADRISTHAGSRLRLDLGSGATAALGEDTIVLLATRTRLGAPPALDLAIRSGIARMDQAEPIEGRRISLLGRFVQSWAIAWPASWIVRSGKPGGQIAVISGRVMASHEFLFWRMVLGPDTGIKRVPDKDVPKFRLPKARQFGSVEMSALVRATDL